ncbi:hypothetical protein Vretimale_13524, partial [Volvox reticuliferus]
LEQIPSFLDNYPRHPPERRATSSHVWPLNPFFEHPACGSTRSVSRHRTSTQDLALSVARARFTPEQKPCLRRWLSPGAEAQPQPPRAYHGAPPGDNRLHLYLCPEQRSQGQPHQQHLIPCQHPAAN